MQLAHPGIPLDFKLALSGTLQPMVTQGKLETFVDTPLRVLLMGIGATLAVDMWAILRRRLLSAPTPNYALVGRWFAHMAHGQFRHQSIAGSPCVRGEQWIGWTAHYAIGVAFAALPACIWGDAWIEHPTIGSALIFGLGTAAAPFFLMQPGMGAGIAGSRTPNPAAARIQSLVTHAVFGLGLYAAGDLIRYLHLP
jgi:hypothetical protein